MFIDEEIDLVLVFLGFIFNFWFIVEGFFLEGFSLFF